MKTARLLAAAGVACLLSGAYAWSQGFNYDCGSYVSLCGYYTCYTVPDTYCPGAGGPFPPWYNRVKHQVLMGGGCIESAGAFCTQGSHDCITSLIRSGFSGCGTQMCTETRTISYCQ